MTHKVGQVVYLLDNTEMKIFPARIEEEIIKRKLGSEEVTYKVLLPDKAQTVVDLGDLDVAIFTSVNELRDHMIGNAVRTIDKFVERGSASPSLSMFHSTSTMYPCETSILWYNLVEERQTCGSLCLMDTT